MSKKRIIEFLIILLLGLTPLLWFRNNEIILGHDAGLTLSPISHFLDRLHPWTDRFGFGNDQTYAIPGFFIHGLEALINIFTNDIQLVQKITFIFWFLLPGVTMYYFASKIAKKYDLTFFALPVTVFYMFNHFLLQGWFVAERTKFSLYAALPLILALLFDWEEKKRSSLLIGILISLILFVFNGEGSLPLFGGLIISILVFIIWYLYQGFTKEKLKRLIYLFLIVGFFSLLLNSYWLLPFIYFISSSFSNLVGQAGGIGGVLGWLSYVSQDSSLINLFRLQGIPEWYQNPFHPYANNFLGNPLLVISGFMIPLLAFLPLLVYHGKQHRKLVLFFSLLALLSMIFIAGSHPPFGAIYVFLVNFVPGFIAFRTPFYKFAPALWLAYAVLIGLSLNYFLQKLSEKKKILSYITYGIFTAVIVLYSYPFLTGSFFDYIKDLRSMRVTVPNYIYEYGKWSESKDRINIRTLVLPAPSSAMRVDAYTWGYWSLSPLTSLLSNASIINNTGYLSEDESQLLETLYKKMKNNEPGWQNLAKLLNIHSFVLRNDFAWNLKETPTERPEIYKDALNSENIHLIKKFGEWEVYDFTDNTTNDKFKLVDTLYYLQGAVEDIGNVSSTPNFNSESIIYTSDTASTTNREEILNRASTIFVSPRCIMCTLVPPFVNEALFVPTFTADSYLYPLIQLIDKDPMISSEDPPALQVEYYLDKSLKDQKGAERVIDEKKSNEAMEKVISRYLSTMIQLNEALSNLVENKTLGDNDLLVKAYAYLRIERKNFIEKFSVVAGEIRPDLTNNLYNQIERAFNLAKNNAWFTNDLINKKYVVSSPKEDSYTLAIKSDTLSISQSLDERTFVLSLDNNNFNSRPVDMGNGWWSLGTFTLAKGLHTVNFADSPLLNLYNGAEVISVRSDEKNQSCYKSSVIPSEFGEIFNISMDFIQKEGSANYFFIPLQRLDDIPVLGRKGLSFKQSSNQEKLSTTYTANNNDGFYFMICPRIESETPRVESLLEVSNIIINRITSPELLLYNSISSNINDEDNLFINKKSQTDYIVKNSEDLENEILLFSSSYSPSWNLVNAKSTDFMANGYSKAWIVKEKTNEIEVKYATQELVKLGFVITLVSFMSILIFFTISGYKKYVSKF